MPIRVTIVERGVATDDNIYSDKIGSSNAVCLKINKKADLLSQPFRKSL